MERFPWCSVIINIAIFGHEIWKLKKVSDVAYGSSIYLTGSFFCSTGRCFQDTGQFSKFPCYGMKSGIWKKGPKLHMYFLPQGVDSVLFPLHAALFKIRADFQNFHILAWNLEFEDRFKSCICTLFLPNGFEIKLIFALRAAVSRYGWIFKFSIFGHQI